VNSIGSKDKEEGIMNSSVSMQLQWHWIQWVEIVQNYGLKETCNKGHSGNITRHVTSILKIARWDFKSTGSFSRVLFEEFLIQPYCNASCIIPDTMEMKEKWISTYFSYTYVYY
jgi:hypothetical protein